MIICFGLSWPFSVYKSYTARSAKGKSLQFEIFIEIGYIFGIIRKFILIANGEGHGWLFYLALVFYFVNMALIAVDMMLYVRNVRLDREAERAA